MPRYKLAEEQTTSRYQEPGSSDEYREIRVDDDLTGERVTVRVYAPFGQVEDAFLWALEALKGHQ